MDDIERKQQLVWYIYKEWMEKETPETSNEMEKRNRGRSTTRDENTEDDK